LLVIQTAYDARMRPADVGGDQRFATRRRSDAVAAAAIHPVPLLALISSRQASPDGESGLDGRSVDTIDNVVNLHCKMIS